jgi:hypothetical protein
LVLPFSQFGITTFWLEKQAARRGVGRAPTSLTPTTEVTMARADSHNSIFLSVDPSRRRFLTVTAAASAVSVTALAAAAMPVHQSCEAGMNGALERIEFIVRTLRESFVREGWKLNEPDAARVIRYFRWAAEGRPEPDPDPEAQFAWKWINAHGQSIDWIVSGDPRKMICAGAALREAA